MTNKKGPIYKKQKSPMSERRDSNSRPSRWQRDALPAELLSHNHCKLSKTMCLKTM